jgi:two-component system sensor histidine kinase DesK
MAVETAPLRMPATAADTALEVLEDLVVSSGVSPRLWRLYAQAWLICLLFPILELVQQDLAPAPLVLAVAGLVLFVSSYTWVMWTHPVRSVARGPSHKLRSLLLLVSLTALVLVLSVAYGRGFLWLFVGVSAIAGVTLPLRSAFGVVVVLTLLTLGVGVGMSGGVTQADWLHIVPLVLLVRGLGVDMIGIARLAAALRDVHQARQELARMAVMEERLRVARDLHDLLGHTLSLIVLKSELARRLAEQEPQRAAHEIQEVERVARQTLREVRAAVAGYRHPRLASELGNARQLLDAAGIACQIEHRVSSLPPALDAVLGWVVREGVTNIIRHSRARRCRITVAGNDSVVHAEVWNDTPKLLSQASHQMGNGLTGLHERVHAMGGQVEANPVQMPDGAGFRLWVELPLPLQRADRTEEHV